jgi:DNA polymerase-3 subunit epsilon
VDRPASIRSARFAAIDFESAGAARGRTDVPVQIGLAEWSVDGGHARRHVSYLATDRPITWSARKVHGIRDEDLADAPTLRELWPVVRDFLSGAVVVAHGMGTEKRFLRAFPGHGFGPWVDSLQLARTAWPHAEDHSLSDLCNLQGLSGQVRTLVPDRSWHDALFDSVASLCLTERIVSENDLADRDLDLLLHADLSAWLRARGR